MRTACICPAISIAVKTMRRGEVAELAVKFLCKLFRAVRKTRLNYLSSPRLLLRL